MKVGDFLKAKRLEKGYSYEYVTEKTKINIYILEKLENNESESILDEAFIIGFIQNLSELYEVDPKEGIELYRQDQKIKKKNDKIDEFQKKEKPVLDSEEKIINSEEQKTIKTFTVESKSKNFEKKYKLLFQAFIIIFILTSIILVGYRLYFKDKDLAFDKKDENKKNYKMNNNEAGFDLKVGDSVDIFFLVNYKKLVLNNYENDEILFTLIDKKYSLKEGSVLDIDLDGNGENDLSINFKKGNGELVYIYVQFLNNQNEIDYKQIWENKEKVLVGYEYTLLEYSDKIPIHIHIEAVKLSSYISFIIDGDRQSNYTLLPGKSTDILAQDTLEISIGNYKSVRLFINKIPLNLVLDHDKFSVTKIVKWIRDPNNETKYNLLIKDYVQKP